MSLIFQRCIIKSLPPTMPPSNHSTPPPFTVARSPRHHLLSICSMFHLSDFTFRILARILPFIGQSVHAEGGTRAHVPPRPFDRRLCGPVDVVWALLKRTGSLRDVWSLPRILVIKDNMFKDLSISIIIFIIIIVHIPGPITTSNGMYAGWYPILTTLLVLITHTHTHTHTGSFLGFSFWSSSSTAEPYRRSPSLETRPGRGTTPTPWCPAHIAAPRQPETLAPVYRCTDQLQPLTDKRSE